MPRIETRIAAARCVHRTYAVNVFALAATVDATAWAFDIPNATFDGFEPLAFGHPPFTATVVPENLDAYLGDPTFYDEDPTSDVWLVYVFADIVPAAGFEAGPCDESHDHAIVNGDMCQVLFSAVPQVRLTPDCSRTANAGHSRTVAGNTNSMSRSGKEPTALRVKESIHRRSRSLYV